MSEFKRKKKSDETPLPPTITRQSYTDPDGIERVVIAPEGERDLATGIPVSMDLDVLYAHMPAEWRRSLYAALHAQGLIEPADYFKPGASDRFRAAMLTVIRHDFLNAQSLANDLLQGRR